MADAPIAGALTQHGRERGRERLSLPPQAMTKLARRAYAEGKAPSAFAGKFRRYLEGRAQKGACHVRVYGEHIYVFGADVNCRLITVLLVPGEFRALLRRLRAAMKES
jgi:hypothetical protein